MVFQYASLCNLKRQFIHEAFLPAKASCLMKKFILDLRLFKYKVISTALFPKTIVAKSIHNTVNCSVWKKTKKWKFKRRQIDVSSERWDGKTEITTCSACCWVIACVNSEASLLTMLLGICSKRQHHFKSLQAFVRVFSKLWLNVVVNCYKWMNSFCTKASLIVLR